MEKRTKFVKNTTQPTTQPAPIPYTNTITVSGRVCEKPLSKDIGKYTAVSFSLAHWQPKNKPVAFFDVLVYNGDLFEKCLELHKGQQIICTGKFGYDTHNGIAKLFILCDAIQTETDKEGQ